MMTLSENHLTQAAPIINEKLEPRSNSLPGTWYYSSNHILINNERVKRGLQPLTRRRDLDEMARTQSEAMAKGQQLFYEAPNTLQKDIEISHRWLGENVARGKSIRHVHEKLMNSNADRANFLDCRFNYLGIGSTRGNDGRLYICQLFLG
uniref:SCP domain-containing protein n=1 Tax=Helicotheca tamesis TaxID=374047 RepID=A0A6U0HIT3_9STRA|mmetsp:Transcript_6622/g.8946  ORF Transcript_6622/g.8946 Transcript_6622/m.8946 type:complete len:150 (+) Transcript_6622:169-618(+)